MNMHIIVCAYTIYSHWNIIITSTCMNPKSNVGPYGMTFSGVLVSPDWLVCENTSKLNELGCM